MSQRSVVHTSVLYAVFTATGVGCALPGVLLPSLIAQWRLTDLHAGTLLLLVWIGSSLGALATRGRLTHRLAAGSLAVAAGAAGLARAGVHLSAPSSFVYGLGLGMCMTSISLLRQRLRADRRGLELVRLNLTWAVGAFLAAAAALHALATGRPALLLSVVAAFFLLTAVWAATAGRSETELPASGGFTVAAWKRLGRVPLALVLLTIAAPGMESASGAWLATYAQRTAHALAWTAGAPSCLWAGLLLSRLAGSAFRKESRLQRSTGVLLGGAVAASLLLVARPSGPALLCGAFLLGFSLGPLYPLLLARVMAIEETGTIFFLAGVAAALLPWLTGAVASASGSLRIGMASIAAVACIAFMLNWRLSRRTSE